MKTSRTIFLSTIFVFATLLALLTHFAAENNLLSLWLGIYGLMFLLTYPHKKTVLPILLSAIIPSYLAAIPFIWQFNHNHTAFLTYAICTSSAYALNAFHIHYQTHRFCLDYKTLFYAVWDTFSQLFVASLFLLICWIILLLTDQLFQFVGITIIKTLISKSWFDVWCSSVFVGIGLFITTQVNQIVSSIRTVLLLLCRYLFLPLSIIGIFFIATFIMKRLDHHNASATQIIFLSIAFLSVLFLNGTYQAGGSTTPYSRFLFWICRVFLWIAPIFSLIALYNIYHVGAYPIVQDGFNSSNFPYFIGALLLFMYNACYAIIALCRETPWFKSIEKTNVILAIVLIATTVLAFNPWLTGQLPAPPPYTAHKINM